LLPASIVLSNGSTVTSPEKADFQSINPGVIVVMGVKKTGKGRRKLGRKKRRNRARIRHRKG
jgi:hypothetical protein